jgi:hypothetical protein
MSWHNPLSQRRIHFFDDVNRFGVRLEEALDGIPAFNPLSLCPDRFFVPYDHVSRSRSPTPMIPP